MTATTKLALLLYYLGLLGLIVGGCFVSISEPDISIGLKWELGISNLFMIAGVVLCWKSGWQRFNAECATFAGKSLTRFVVYVLGAPFTLPFRHIEFPKWLP